MIITVKNLGVIKKAEFDTTKRLTLFCGPNSTGKTYMANLIYAIFVNAKNNSNLTTNSWKKKIGEIFGIAEENENSFFKNFSVKNSAPNEIIEHNAYIFPVERNSIYTFKTELSINKNLLLDKIYEEKNNLSKVSDLLGRNVRRYPLSIKDNLYTANDLDTVKKFNGELRKFAEELENDILHGTIHINENGEVYYKTKDGVFMHISVAASVIKTLASLVITLKYQANKGDILIIDEPEMNLHPDNQVLLAKILAKIANQTPMVVSTHSDYIIREINNMIVSKSLSDKGKDTYKEFYEKDSLLDYKDVQVLYFDFAKDGKVNVKSLEVDEYGFAVDSMDETIRSQNQRSNSLYIEMDNDEN